MGRLIIALLLTLPVASAAQTTVKNPSLLVFVSPDHAIVTAYELDLVRASDNATIYTLVVPKSQTRIIGPDVEIDIHVQPVPFGSYKIVVRAVVGTLKSDNSAPSDVWERVPETPTSVMVRP
jgi:hypothetical protein